MYPNGLATHQPHYGLSLGEEKDANSPRFQDGAQDEAMTMAGPLGLLWGPQGRT